MPFSRYQIRNEFSLADPELYKAADKDDPEALLEGVAMAGLVGVLRQLGDLAEFAAEIFHGLHEEVMVTAARGHGLLGRVQQLESDFPLIERAFLSQTSHSAFFSSSGIGWHPNLKTEQNLITRGDLPRFVMDSYEECRGPPRLFLLDKFDVAGAGACLKRYTDPSFYKVEASSYEMMSVEAQRDKKIRKTKKKAPRWKNGETPEVFQPSHVKLHQLLLEERVQNGASEPARRVKLKKREIKFPFDTENGKGYMEKLLNSPPQDKLVHEVNLTQPTVSSSGPVLETHEIRMIEPTPNGTSFDSYEHESQIVDKTVSSEHSNTVENIVDEKHISDGYKSDDVASEGENYLDALATMESEIETETDAEIRANSEQNVKQESDSDSEQNIEPLQSKFLDSPSESDDESSSVTKKITSFSYSDTASNSADDNNNNMSPRGIDSSQAFASIEIPFRPRVLPNSDLKVDEGEKIEENDSKELDLSEISSNNCVDENNIEKTEEVEIDLEDIIARSPRIDDPSSSSFVRSPESEVDEEECNYDSTLVEEQAPIGGSLDEADVCDADVEATLPKERELIDDIVESKSSEDERELNAGEIVDSESKGQTCAINDPTDDINIDNELHTLDDEKVKEVEFVNLETKDAITADISNYEDTKLERREVESVNSETEAADLSVENNDDESEIIQNSNEFVENKELISPSEYNDQSDMQFIDSIHNSSHDTCDDENDINNILSPKKELTGSGEMNESNVDDVANLNILQEEGLFVTEETHLNDVSVSPDVDQFVDQDVESNYLNQVDDIEKLEDESSVPIEEKADQSETLDSGNNMDIVNNVGEEVEYPSILNMLPEVVSPPINLEEMPPLPPLPPMQWRLGKMPNSSFFSKPGQLDQPGQLGQPSFNSFPPAFPQITSSSSLDQIEVSENEKLFPMPDGGQLGQLGQPSINNFPPAFSQNTSQHGQFGQPSQFGQLGQHDQPSINNSPPSFPQTTSNSSLDGNEVSENEKLAPMPDDGQHGQPSINNLPPSFSQITTPPSLDSDEITSNEKLIPTPDDGQHGQTTENEKSEVDNGDAESSLHTEEDEKLVASSEVKTDDKFVPRPPLDNGKSRNVSTSIIRPSSTSSLPLVDDDNERPNGIRPMKIQRPRTPLIDAVAAHDKTKLRKVSERAMPPTPKEEERDTLLEQIRAKSFNLKPAVQTRPSIQGPSTNLRVAAILEKANAIRQAFAGSDDDEDDDDDSWSDS